MRWAFANSSSSSGSAGANSFSLSQVRRAVAPRTCVHRGGALEEPEQGPLCVAHREAVEVHVDSQLTASA
jgi:hypothetical protein